MKVEPSNIYVISTNKMLVANDGILQISGRPKDKKNNLIDVFFESLAEVHQSHSIGIILSGTGADGTLGLRKIKEHGGITFAQDPVSAAYEDMPQSAVKSEVVDFIFPPEEMPQRLLEIVHTLGRFDEDGNPDPEKKSEEESFRQILALLRLRFGADFSFYKQTTVRRRILRRVAILNIGQINDYLKYLEHYKEELATLFQDLLIPVTGFFRDSSTFENVCETVLPTLLEGKNTVNPLRIWVCGCSTGEEAYSLGMCLHEFLSDKIFGVKI